jgi:hypothetical protein
MFCNLFGQGLPSGVVLCVAGNEHAAVEPVHYSSHHPILDLASKFGQADDFTILQAGLKGNSYGSCFDIPVSTTFLPQHISTDLQSFYEAETGKSYQNTFIFNPDPNTSRQTFSAIPSLGSSALTCLQTTILII